VDSWTSLDQVVEQFGLDADPRDRESVREALLSELLELHPDKHGGDFPDIETSDRYHSVMSALEFIDRSGASAGALIPVDQLPAIVKSIANALTTVESGSETIDTGADIAVEIRHGVRRRLFLPRLTSATLAAVSGTLFTLSGTVAEHPVVSFFEVSAAGLSVAMFFTTLVFAMFFVLTWVREQRELAAAEFLMTEEGLLDGLRRLFEDGTRPLEGDTYGFTIHDVREHAVGWRVRDQALAEKVAAVMVNKLLRRRVVRRRSEPSVVETYEVDGDTVHDVRWRLRPT
jgi:hypothetical protein